MSEVKRYGDWVRTEQLCFQDGVLQQKWMRIVEYYSTCKGWCGTRLVKAYDIDEYEWRDVPKTERPRGNNWAAENGV